MNCIQLGGRAGKTDLAHGAEERFHASAGEAPCWGRLEEDGAERDGGAVGDVEGDDGLDAGEDEVECAMLSSADMTPSVFQQRIFQTDGATHGGTDEAVKRTESAKETGASAYGLVSRLTRGAG